MIPGTHLQYTRTQDQATRTRYVPTTKGNIPTQKKKTRDTCIQQCTRLLLMGMSVGREFETRHPFIFISCFMFSFLCATHITRHIRGTYVQLRATAPPQKKTRDTCMQQCTRYRLAADGHVGRSRVRNPAPLYFL